MAIQANPENITETFVPYYDHFPVCLSRKVNVKYLNLNISPPLTAVSRNLMNDLSSCLEYFTIDQESVDEDFAAWHSVLIQFLDNHVPIKHKRVKSSSLLVWYVPEKGRSKARNLRDKFKHLNEWPEYKKHRNKAKNLIRNAKRKYFADCGIFENTSSISALNKAI